LGRRRFETSIGLSQWVVNFGFEFSGCYVFGLAIGNFGMMLLCCDFVAFVWIFG
jgi:hypothetical protein